MKKVNPPIAYLLIGPFFKGAAHFDPCFKSDPVFSEPWPNLFLD
jgi:hypothetical protein